MSNFISNLKNNLNEKIRSIKISKLGLLLIPLIILGSFQLIAFNIHYYDKLFGTYGSNSKLNSHDLGSQIIDFFNYQSELSSPFTESEISHMQDVRNIFLVLRIILIISILALVIAFIKKIKENRAIQLFADFKNGAIYSFIVICLLALASIPFSYFFTAFHFLFFPQGNWSFPSDSSLIMLFPQEFFQRIFLDILVLAALFSVLLFSITHVLEKIMKIKGFTNHEQ